MKKSFHNLKAFLSAYKSTDIIESYKNINKISDMKSYELNDIKIVAEKIVDMATSRSQLFGYYFDKTIEITIREQFDMLRFSGNSILNIELKSKPKERTEILDQLIRHHYLLNCIPGDRSVYLFTYVSSTDTLYEYVNGDIIESSFENLISCISPDYIEEDLLSILKPEDFIISPYSDIARFVDFKYFLNTEQRKFVDDQLADIDSSFHCMIKGGAGTGKSLVLFDLAKKYSALGKKVLFIFCSALDNFKEIDQHLDFTFVDILHSNISNLKPGDFDFIIIDESQRLRESQYYDLFKCNIRLIFGVDKAQTLRPEEDILDVEGKLNAVFSNHKKYDLTEKVRTDRSLATFIFKLFDKSTDGLQPIDFPKVNAVYFSNKPEAIKFLEDLEKVEQYVSIEVPQYKTRESKILKNPKIYSNSLDGFTVIGREFDNVVVPMDTRVNYYDNKLYFTTSGYFPYKANSGLFQAITRVKKNLLFVVIENPSLYIEIQRLINWENDRNVIQTSKRLIRLREITNSKVSEIARACKCSEETYQIIERTGIFPNNKILNKLSIFYNIRSDFLLGEPTQLSYTDFDILYQLKTKGMNEKQKEDLNKKLIHLLK